MSKADILKLGTVMNGSVFHVWMIFVFAMLASSAQAEENKDMALFDNYCVKCHDAEKHKGDIRLDQLALRVTADNHELWKEVVHNIQRGDMPPEDAKQHRYRTTGFSRRDKKRFQEP